MALDFPASPSTGQIFKSTSTDDNRQWIYDGEKWIVQHGAWRSTQLTFDDPNGRIGVNDETPTYGLDINRSVRITGDLTVNGTTTTVESTTIAVQTSLTFEGSTDDAYETTLQVTDPTADRTITLPDTTGTVALTSDISGVYALLASPALTGAPTAPSAASDTNTTQIATTAYVQTELGDYLTTSTASSTYLPLAGGSLTGDISITSTDTGDAAAPIIDLVRDSASPAAADYLGQIKFTGDDSGGASHTYAKITGKIDDPTAGGEDGLIEFAVVSGGSNEIVARLKNDGLYLNTANTVRFEGATADAHETTLTVADPTADRTITLPDASGTVALLASPTFTGTVNAAALVAPLAINAQTGTTYTFLAEDSGKLVTSSNGSAQTFTVPPNSSVAFDVGTQIMLQNIGSANCTLAQGSGVTIQSVDSNKEIDGQFAAATLIKTATDTWSLIGSLK